VEISFDGFFVRARSVKDKHLQDLYSGRETAPVQALALEVSLSSIFVSANVVACCKFSHGDNTKRAGEESNLNKGLKWKTSPVPEKSKDSDEVHVPTREKNDCTRIAIERSNNILQSYN